MVPDFFYSLEIGELGQEVSEALMTKQGFNFIRTEHTKYAEMELDFESDYYIKDEKTFIEVKCLAGGTNYGSKHNTFCIEKYKNKNLEDTETNPKYPGWIRTCQAGQKLKIYIFNRREKAVYIYDGNKMYDLVMNYNGRLSKANDGNKDDSGFLVLIPWRCEEAGFICKYTLTKFRGINYKEIV